MTCLLSGLPTFEDVVNENLPSYVDNGQPVGGEVIYQLLRRKNEGPSTDGIERWVFLVSYLETLNVIEMYTYWLLTFGLLVMYGMQRGREGKLAVRRGCPGWLSRSGNQVQQGTRFEEEFRDQCQRVECCFLRMVCPRLFRESFGFRIEHVPWKRCPIGCRRFRTCRWQLVCRAFVEPRRSRHSSYAGERFSLSARHVRRFVSRFSQSFMR